MPQNAARRRALADAGIRVLAEEGARGLTHRAVDRVAGTPLGTASNYFSTRDGLIAAMVERIGERLTPAHDATEARRAQPRDAALLTTYLRDVVRRLCADPHVPLALFELRLEATRRPEVAATLRAWRQDAFRDDVEFNVSQGLPGGRTELALLHYAVDGLMLDHLTIPLDTGLSVDVAVEELVTRILA